VDIIILKDEENTSVEKPGFNLPKTQHGIPEEWNPEVLLGENLRNRHVNISPEMARSERKCDVLIQIHVLSNMLKKMDSMVL
jgi:hypothetical protein